jgi:hypothetical protein
VVFYLNKLNSEGGLADTPAAEDDNLVLSHPRVDGPGRRSGRLTLYRKIINLKGLHHEIIRSLFGLHVEIFLRAAFCVFTLQRLLENDIGLILNTVLEL